MIHLDARAQPGVVDSRLFLVGVFFLALLIRITVIGATIGFYTPAAFEPASDSRIHIELVRSLLTGEGYSLRGKPTAITPPLYPLFLAGLYRVFDSPVAVRLSQALLGAATCLLLYAAGRRLLGPTTGGLAALVLSGYPLVAYLSGLHLTENLFLFLVMLMVWVSTIVADLPTLRPAAALGALVGLAALTRAVFLGFLPFLLLWAVIQWGIRSPIAYRVFGVAVVTAILIILPWTIRNYLVLSAVVPIQSNGGMVFWAGNNPHANGGMVMPSVGSWTGDPPDDGMYGWRELTVAQTNRRYVQAATSWIRTHPRAYLRLVGMKLVRLYGFARATDDQGLEVPPVVLLVHAGVYVAALAGLVLASTRRRQAAMLILLMVFTNLVAILFSGATRYTVPMVPSIALFAGYAMARSLTVLRQGVSE